MEHLIHNHFPLFPYPDRNSWTGVCVFVFVFVVLVPQLWADYIQTCYIGSAWPQLVYLDVFIFAGGLRGRGQGKSPNSPSKCVSCIATSRSGRVLQVSTIYSVQYSCPRIFQCPVRCFELYAVGMFLLHAHNFTGYSFFFVNTELSVVYTPPK